ncbi:MAG: hypothetical protein K9K37_09230 [Desulfocapsa sp.]|nr:hypothetical protein [Desulfocapsa sp.]
MMFPLLKVQKGAICQDESCGPFAEKASWIILGIGLVAGLVFRLRMYLQDRSFWLDTANLANNIVEKDYQALWGLLDGDQSAPVGFLLVSKLVGSFFGYSELSLTFPAFLFGTGALILFLFLAIAVLGRCVAPLAFIPFAVCSTAVYYSGEFKQYSADLFFSVLILFVAHRVLRKRFSRSGIIAFGIVGLLSVWFSHTAIFMLSGTGLALFLNALKEAGLKAVLPVTLAGTVIFAHFIALYLFQIRPATVESMYSYWSMGFAPVVPLSPETIDWWSRTMIGYVTYPLGFHGYGVWFSLTALLFGVVYVGSFMRSILGLLLFPVVLLVLFSIFHLYPIATGDHDIHSRLLLFTIPIAFLLIAVGINGFARLFPRPLLVTAILGGLLIYSPINHMLPWPRFMRQEMKPLVAYLYQYLSAEDSVYVYDRAVPAFCFYTRGKPVPFVKGTTVVADELPKDLRRVETRKRIWTVISHDFTNNRGVIRRELEAFHGPVSSKKFPGAWLLWSRSPIEMQGQSPASK